MLGGPLAAQPALAQQRPGGPPAQSQWLWTGRLPLTKTDREAGLSTASRRGRAGRGMLPPHQTAVTKRLKSCGEPTEQGGPLFILVRTVEQMMTICGDLTRALQNKPEVVKKIQLRNW